MNNRCVPDNSVTAIIQVKATPMAVHGYNSIAKTIAQFEEVKSVYLMSSGNYDLSLMVNCADLKRVGLFVAEKLSTIEGVLSTATHFIMGCYKEAGVPVDDDMDDRGLYTV